MTTPEFLSRLQGVSKTASGWMARCPGHEDGRASLSVSAGDGDRVLVKCHAGCTVTQVSEAMGIRVADLFADPSSPCSSVSNRIVATYDYVGEGGEPLFQVVRIEPKTYRQRRVDPSAAGGWAWNLGDVRRVLFRLPRLLAAIRDGRTVYLVEGEKDVIAMEAQGFTATCNSGGAGKWRDEYTDTLRGGDVVIINDKDEPGRKHAELVAEKIAGTTKQLRIVELPDVNGIEVKDAHDYFAAGGTAADLSTIVSQSVPIGHEPATQGGADPINLPPDDDADDESEPFPVECLPADIAAMVRAVSDAQGVPDSLPGLMALALVSASIGKGLALDWRPGKSPTPANLFVILSASSGVGKSEVYKLLARDYLDFERKMQERWRREVLPTIQADLRFHEIQLKKLDRKLGRENTAPEDIDHCLAQMQFHLAAIDDLKRRVHEPQISIQDSTVERIATVLHDNDEIIFSQSADARKLVDNILGRYSASKKIADDGIYLAGFSGDDVKVDRQGREGVRLANPCIVLLWAVQPDVLEILLDEESLQQGGFIGRCLVANTNAEPQHIGDGRDGIADGARTRWRLLIETLLTTYRKPPILTERQSTTLERENPVRTYPIHPTPEARERLELYFNEIVDRRRAGELSDLSQYASRWCEQSARLAVVLHAGLYGADGHDHQLVLETVENAVVLAKWFADQQLRLLAKGRRKAAQKIDDQVFELLKSNHERKRKDFVSAREIQRARIAVSAVAAHTLLARMEQDGLLEGENVIPAGGGKVTRIFRRIRNPKTV